MYHLIFQYFLQECMDGSFVLFFKCKQNVLSVILSFDIVSRSQKDDLTFCSNAPLFFKEDKY